MGLESSTVLSWLSWCASSVDSISKDCVASASCGEVAVGTGAEGEE